MQDKKGEPKRKDRAFENVQVVVRCRPMNSKEESNHETCIAKCNEFERTISIMNKSSKPKAFKFDRVYGPNITQKEIYNDAITPIVDEALNGFNCTIFAYGQTGTGKTYTMEGLRGSLNDSARWKANMEAGIITRAIHHVFDSLEKSGHEYFVRVSHLELYNENLSDLLNPVNTNLRLYKDEKNRVYVHNLEEVRANNPQDIFNILEKSWEERKTAETDLNDYSSRSHCIFSITIQIKESTTEGEDFIKIGKLNFVDLAGSENIGRSGADKVYSRKQEAGNINKSLLTLGRVITSLTENSPHIPYRESKLTHLLQDSLGGKTKTCIIATISPSSGNFEETMSTLDYAHRAKNIKNKPEVNQKMAQKEVIKEYTEEIANLQKQLDCMKKKDGIYIPHDRFNEMQSNMTKAKEEIKFLEERIEEKEKLLKDLVDELENQSKELQEKEMHLNDASEELEKKQNELLTTKNELEGTIEDLNEHKVLLDEHRTTEEKFQNEAKVVLNTLSTTIGDINGLFNKIHRKDHLESANMDLTDAFRDQLIRQMNETENKLNRFIQASSQNHLNMKKDISTFMEDKMNGIASIENNLKEFEQGIQKKSNEIEAIQKENAQSLSKVFDNIQTTQESYEQEHTNVREQFVSESYTVIENLRRGIKEQNDFVNEWVSERERNVLKSFDTLESFSTLQKERISESKNKVQQFISSHTDRLSGHRTTLDTFLAQQKEQMESFKASTLALVTEILDQQLDAHMTRTISSIQEIQKAFDTSSERTIQFDQSFKENCEELLSGASNFLDGYQTEQKGLIQSIEDFKKDEISFVNSYSQTIQTYRQNVGDYKTKTESTYKRLIDELTNQCNVGNTLIDANIKDNHEHIDSLNQFSINTKQSIIDDLTKHSESIDTYTKDFISGIETTSNNTNDFISGTIKHNMLTKEKVKSFNLQNYLPTGETPIKRNIEYPTKLSRTRNHEDVLREYRSKKENNGSMRTEEIGRAHV